MLAHPPRSTLVVSSHLHGMLPARVVVLAHAWRIVCQENITIVYTGHELLEVNKQSLYHNSSESSHATETGARARASSGLCTVLYRGGL